MAGLTFRVEKDLQDLANVIRTFPKLRVAVFRHIGRKGRRELKARLLSGLPLDLHEYPRDRRGRPTVSNVVLRGASGVRWSSYPVNLFERGRRLRSGRREAGQRIIGTKFKSIVGAKLQVWANEAMLAEFGERVGND